MKAATGLRRVVRGLVVSTGAKALWESHRDLKILILLRMVRLLGHGGTTMILAVYLHGLGLPDSDVGLFMTLTLIGDLAISSGLVYLGDVLGVRVVAAIGSLLIANEIDPFKPVEESAISRLSTTDTCSDMFAWWSMLGMFGTAASNLLTGFIVDYLQRSGYPLLASYKIVFLCYAGIGLTKLLCGLLLSSDVELRPIIISDDGSKAISTDCSDENHQYKDMEQHTQQDYGHVERAEETQPLLFNSTTNHNYSTAPSSPATSSPPLQAEPTSIAALPSDLAAKKPMFTPQSLSFMTRLSASLIFDFIGSGLAQISWMTYFFKREYDVPDSSLGTATFAAGLVSSLLNLASSPLARAIGQVQTMVACHAVNSASLLMVSVPGDRDLALAIFIFRILTREMDNAPRQAFIARGVEVDERTAAMAVVNVIKTAGSCIGLYATGWFAAWDAFWWAFIVAGCLKLVYNVLISVFFWGT
ncbi:hypothetical protein KVR01_012697 [Diaporthe batatas]|uniref:uncharacterized protein n=1 Tax=Diaporthe batatas TaxID=748121 RepID=UPI001D05B330|nr:uncharacterized protein KVR01_012697 [Diaporthe batatas]KAG8157313.1 hypothetical protein KVR01_012697 [Diaporthe batatas]